MFFSNLIQLSIYFLDSQDILFYSPAKSLRGEAETVFRSTPIFGQSRGGQKGGEILGDQGLTPLIVDTEDGKF